MANLNKVLLIGRLTRDPELRYTPQGVPVTDVGLAINREYQGQDGERRKDTVFVDVTFWRRRAEVVCQYLKKGEPLYLEGRLTLDTWETQEGQKRSKLKVVGDSFQFLSGRGDRGEGGGEFQGASSGSMTTAQSPGISTDYEYPGDDKPADGGATGDRQAVDESDVPF